jgi:PAS domain S-box-containing protein
VARASQRPGEQVPGPRPIDGVHELLDALIAELRRGPAERMDGELPAVAAVARRHAGRRLEMGVDLSRLVWEHAQLRKVVLDVAEEAGHALTFEEIRVVTEVVASCISGAMRSYTDGPAALLRATQERFVTIADHAPAVMFVKDAQTRYRFVNRFAAEILGLQKEALLGRTNRDLFPADAVGDLAADDARALDGEVVTREETVPTPTGLRTFQMVKFPLPRTRDEPTIAGIGLDVTDRNAVEAEARQAAELLEFGDAFFELDRDWRIVRVNRNQEKLSGRPRAETLGRVFWDLWPETRDEADSFWREYHRVMEDRITRKFEAYYPPVDLWLDITAYPVSGGGIAVFLRDVSRRKRGERELGRAVALLEGALASAPVGFAFLDRELRYVRVNDVLARMNGTTAADAAGRTLREGTPALAERLEPLAQRVLETGESFVEQEIPALVAGSGAEWLASCYPIRLPDDPRPFAVGMVVADVTERKRAERDTQRTREFERELVGMVSHDLRNPLNAVLLSTRTLLPRADLADVHRAAITRIKTASERAVRLVCDLLDLTRARLGSGIPVEPRDADLHAIAREVIDELQPAFPGREVRLEASGQTRGSWDPDRLAQVLSNLLANALKFSPPETPVSVRLEGGAAQEVQVHVHNEGAPIDPALLPSVFEPWKRTERSLGGGLGLGLFIAERLVHAHQGSMSVVSSPSAGTTFTVVLPRAASGTRPGLDSR